LTCYLIAFFGEILPSQISPTTIKQYRRRIHEENAHIRTARAAKRPLQGSRTGKPLRTLSNDSINKTLRTLAAILDEAEDAGWITRNVARGRRTREPIERRSSDARAPDQFAALLEAAGQVDSQRHKPQTLVRARMVQQLRDEGPLMWKEIADRVGTSPSSAIYLDQRQAE
jgi:hypothetical protein